MSKKTLILCVLLLALLLSACGEASTIPLPAITQPEQKEPVVIDGVEYEPKKTTEITAVVTNETIGELEKLPKLQSADLRGSDCLDAILAYIAAHPEVSVRYSVRVADGLTVENDTAALDLSALPRRQLEEALETLKYLPALQALELGLLEDGTPAALVREQYPALSVSYTPAWRGEALDLNMTRLDLSTISAEDAQALVNWMPLLHSLSEVELGSGDAENPNIPWETVAALRQAAPQAHFSYAFTLYGKELTLDESSLDLNHIRIYDQGALVKLVTRCMPSLRYLDMDFCGVDDEYMAEIRDDLPNTEVVWRVWFGTGYTARTDVERILASNPGIGGELCPENTHALKYCTKVKHLDLGHNAYLGNIDFCAYMPELETLIIALSDVSDLRPLANCPHLTYAELQTSALNDLSPLSGLKELKYLNICYNFAITDITPLYGLTQLERLWIGCLDPVPPEQVEMMRSLAPDCEVNDEDLDPTREQWRWDGEYANGALKPAAAYEKLRVDMQYDNAPYSYSYIRNDSLYYPHGQGDNTTPPTWFTEQVPIPVDYTVY